MVNPAKGELRDVSDTALWVAVYRAQETERPDALFRDPLAARLTGERGRRIAARMSGSRYAAWSVVLRTCVIDSYIREQAALGTDVVLNLGAGLDTRPYRLELPAGLRWIEVDYPHMIEHKNEHLRGERERCRLERVPLDLADRDARRRLLASVGAEGKNVLVLTEGVLPYLTEEQVAELAADIREQPTLRRWIVDYFAPEMYGRLRGWRRRRQMRNAPFRFFPPEMRAFFRENGWKVHEMRYLVEASEQLGRPFPMPFLARLLVRFAPEEKREKFRKMLGYALLEPGMPG